MLSTLKTLFTFLTLACLGGAGVVLYLNRDHFDATMPGVGGLIHFLTRLFQNEINIFLFAGLAILIVIAAWLMKKIIVGILFLVVASAVSLAVFTGLLADRYPAVRHWLEKALN